MKFNECKKANIYNTSKTLLCEAKVSDLTDHSATLTIDGALGDSLRTEVMVTFFDSQRGLVTCFCRLSNYKESFSADGSTFCSVHCEIAEESIALQRRNDLKVPVDVTVRAHFKEAENQVKMAKIRILDISAGGMFCVSACRFQVGQTFIFPFWDGNFSLNAEVLREQPPKAYNPTLDEDGLYGYGCRFIHLPDAAESALRGFIYKRDLQRNRAKKK